MLIMPSFKKSLIVEQFQGNYLKPFFSFLFLVPEQVSNHLPFAYLSLASLSFTSLQYLIQLRITPRQIIFILLDSFKCKKNYITIYVFICLMHVSRCTKTCIICLYLGSQVARDDLIISPNRVYQLSSPSFANRSTTARSLYRWTERLWRHL